MFLSSEDAGINGRLSQGPPLLKLQVTCICGADGDSRQDTLWSVLCRGWGCCSQFTFVFSQQWSKGQSPRPPFVSSPGRKKGVPCSGQLLSWGFCFHLFFNLTAGPFSGLRNNWRGIAKGNFCRLVEDCWITARWFWIGMFYLFVYFKIWFLASPTSFGAWFFSSLAWFFFCSLLG